MFARTCDLVCAKYACVCKQIPSSFARRRLTKIGIILRSLVAVRALPLRGHPWRPLAGAWPIAHAGPSAPAAHVQAHTYTHSISLACTLTKHTHRRHSHTTQSHTHALYTSHTTERHTSGCVCVDSLPGPQDSTAPPCTGAPAAASTLVGVCASRGSTRPWPTQSC